MWHTWIEQNRSTVVLVILGECRRQTNKGNGGCGVRRVGTIVKRDLFVGKFQQ
jgi:hypothetical protein